MAKQAIRLALLVVLFVGGLSGYFWALQGPENNLNKYDEEDSTYYSSGVIAAYIANNEYQLAEQYRGKLKILYWLVVLRFMVPGFLMYLKMPEEVAQQLEEGYSYLVDVATLLIVAFWLRSWGVF